jgi:hypothetical protein
VTSSAANQQQTSCSLANNNSKCARKSILSDVIFKLHKQHTKLHSDDENDEETANTSVSDKDDSVTTPAAMAQARIEAAGDETDEQPLSGRKAALENELFKLLQGANLLIYLPSFIEQGLITFFQFNFIFNEKKLKITVFFSNIKRR